MSAPQDPQSPPAPKPNAPPAMETQFSPTLKSPRLRLAIKRPASGRSLLAITGVILTLLLLTVAVAHPWSHTASALRQGTTVAQATPTIGLPTATPTTVPTPTPTLSPLSGLAIQGTQLVDSNGQPIRLIGVNHASLEYECGGDNHFAIADFQAIKDWGANVVRLPLSSRFWANTDNSCPDYRLDVVHAIANARAVGLYVILVLQWNAPFDHPLYTNPDGTANWQYPMPDVGKDVSMWRDLATLYSADTTVLFDLFGEFNAISWSTWANGGPVTTAVGTYTSIGVWDLYTQVRQIAPDNVIIVSGINWGWDLTGLAQGKAIPNATNVMYGSHPWSHWGSVTSTLSVISTAEQHYPVIITEFGEYDNATAWNAGAIDYFNAHHLSWLAWNWSPPGGSTPVMLNDWNGTPSAPYGTFLRQQIQAASKG